VRNARDSLRLEDLVSVRGGEVYHGILQAAGVGILVAEIESRRFIYCNDFMCEWTGYPREELLNLTVDRFHPADQLPRVLAEFEAQARGDKLLAAGLPLLRRSGEILYADITTRATTLGGIACNVGIFFDVTERHQVIAALRESESVAQSLVVSSPMGMHMYRLEDDRRLVFTGANPAADQILGVDNSQFIGQTIEEAFPPLADTEVPARYRQAASEGTPWQTQQVDYADEQIQGAFEVHAFQTRPGEMVALFFDITERKRAETELERYRQHLEDLVAERTRRLEEAQTKLLAADRLAVLGQFAGAIAHEIRNPLAVISNAAYYVKRQSTSDDPRVAKNLDRIEHQVARSTEIIESILNLTKVDLPNLETIEVTSSLKHCIESAQVPERIAVRVELPTTGVFVPADATLLQLACKNLIRNAIQAMPGTGTLTISLEKTGGSDAAGVAVSFSDSGPGIPKSEQESVFEPLFTTRTHGVGLGLAIVKMIMEHHHGSVSLESTVGVGSTFKLWFPTGAGGQN